MILIFREGKTGYTLRFIIKCVLIVEATLPLVTCTSLRIIGGRDSVGPEFSFVARLEFKVERQSQTASNVTVLYYPICTCSVITPVWTLTAFHCVQNWDKLEDLAKGKHIIRYGPPYNKPTAAKESEVIDVLEYPVIRPKLVSFDDIALLKTLSVNLEKYGKISSVPGGSLLFQEVFAVGYGRTNSSNSKQQILQPTLTLSKPLQVVKGMLVKCLNLQYPMMCLNQACGQPTSMCSGDSGGPVIHSSGIVALNSQAPIYSNCQMMSDVYRKAEFATVLPLHLYIDWISKVINI